MVETQERMVFGTTADASLEREHLERYRYACRMAAGADVLDVACGSGYGSRMLADAGARSVRGVDVAPEAVSNASKDYGTANLTFEVGDAENLTNVASASIDLVVSFETIEHLERVDRYLREIARVLRPNGRFLVSTPDRRLSTPYPWRRRPTNPHHRVEYTRRGLQQTLAREFKVIEWCGQGQVPGFWVFWPIQGFMKMVLRPFRKHRTYQIIRRLYHWDVGLEVTPVPKGRCRVPRYWVLCCEPLGH